MPAAWVFFAVCLNAQAQPGDVRQIWDKSRVDAAQAAAKPAPPKPAAPAKPAAAKPAAEPPPAPHPNLIGVTLWLLRPKQAADPEESVIVDVKTKARYTATRASLNTPLTVGQKVRLSIESLRPGYLYVIDREKFTDGTLGEPAMLFPSQSIRGGDNRVEAGIAVEVPGQKDPTPYFDITAEDPRLAAEQITILLTEQPLPGIVAGTERLSPALVDSWEKSWGTSVRQSEEKDALGKLYTKAEREAGESGTRRLSRNDPRPQTTYQVDARPGQALLVHVNLSVRR